MGVTTTSDLAFHSLMYPSLHPLQNALLVAFSDEGLTELGRINKEVVALCADLTGSLKMEVFAKENPNQIIITPHIAGMTTEAQSIAFKKAANLLNDYLDQKVK